MNSTKEPFLTCVYVMPDGQKHAVQTNPGQSVMSAAVRAGVPGIDGVCGGNCTCVTCHVYVGREWLSSLVEQSSMEESMLDFADDVRDTSRLACQIPLLNKLNGLTVYVPDRQRVIGL